MCSFSFSTNPKDLDALNTNNIFLKKRGPDHTTAIADRDFCAIHNLLHVTGNKTPQPIIKRNTYTFFNGEIYNYSRKYSCDSLAVPDLLENVNNFHTKADGEYAIVSFDKERQLVYFLKDIFGTKPLYYSIENGKLLVSSLRSGLYGLSKNVLPVQPNSIYKYNIKTKTLTIDSNAYRFDLEQKNNSLKSFNLALKAAIKKRIPRQKFCVGLSSGVDSGILALHTYREKHSNFISISNNENSDILNDRKNILKDKLTTYTFDTYAKSATLKLLINHSEPKTYIDYNYYKDSSSLCLSQIGQFCNKNHIKVFLSGTGSDEIYSDYGFNGERFTDNSCFGGLYPAQLSDVFPWKNFFEGTMQQYLEKDEKILGSFGLETRYPFLDKNLVQEFLWLTNDIKNKSYKFCLVDKLKRARFPYWTTKRGFSCETK